MNTTTHLGLKKPEINEYVNVGDLNENSDIIDAKVYGLMPLAADTTLYVSVNTGSDTIGDGSKSNPYASFGKALNIIPKNLGGYTATVDISEGAYAERIDIQDFLGGTIRINLSGDVTVQDMRVINSYVICTTSGSVNTLTLSWIYLTTKANIYSSDANFRIHTTGSFASSDTPSIFINDGSDFYIPGLTTLDTHAGVAVLVQHHARAYFGSVKGTGFDIGFGVYYNGRSTCVFNNLNAVKPIVTSSGGIFTKSSGAVIGTLANDVAYYVAITGSDLTGDGTNSNPFATITKALSVIPKDLGGCTANIYIAEGVYNDDIAINGFGSSGIIMIRPSGNITVNKLTVNYSDHVMCISTTGTYTLTTQYILVVDGRLDIQAAVNVVTTGYVAGYPSSGNKASIVANRGDIYISAPIVITGNTDFGIVIISISRMFFNSVSGTGLNVGIFIHNGAIVHCGTPGGVSDIYATTVVQQSSGGMLISSSGTQISGPTTTNLTCAWGTLAGGYYRNGNYRSGSGIAEVIINLRVNTTSALTAQQSYTISGFPTSLTPLAAVATDCPSRTYACNINSSGVITFSPGASFAAGALSLVLTCVYVTNS